ncbi:MULTISPECIES: superoxide dismutase family protein [Acinetobacter]|uniref:superoxide dismutase family protein n=1 Tax=Acinetobacter TaxID=469 RepID=UPI000CEC610A|nr:MULTISPECIES: superoxide dismutase family protein [Acinetobacter]MDM1280258.1 superoxide dismutase family protein [Acinetobacter indicus]MDM1302904.1 superoxide dismutase family protein [Acinetobacter indicus]QOW51977.1 superoxide dismutase family protein [Acinetobacter indicus]QSG84261.1 superoxide dismutase family protein [Acinetobacter indicus]QSQ94446.1 superoxide dismutase family protein [Acinetobacter indicus]
MTPLFKLGALCAFTALIGVGCTTTPDTMIGASKNVAVNAVSAQGIGAQLGEVQLTDSAAGLVIRTNLTQLPPGPHGFHIHENGSCAPAEKDGKMQAALAAGGHFNPNQAPNHGNPLSGHLGDLPVLNVAANGTARVTLLAPRLKLQDVQGLALMIHAGGDNYADTPKPLGGGGDRIACGVI